MQTYDSLLQAISELKKRGFTEDFNLHPEYISGGGKIIKPEEFHVVETHRFEDMSDPDENAVIYAIESKSHKLRGILVNSYGIYAENNLVSLIEKLK